MPEPIWVVDDDHGVRLVLGTDPSPLGEFIRLDNTRFSQFRFDAAPDQWLAEATVGRAGTGRSSKRTAGLPTARARRATTSMVASGRSKPLKARCRSSNRRRMTAGVTTSPSRPTGTVSSWLWPR